MERGKLRSLGEARLIDTGEHLSRVRRLCALLPGTTEKLSHGAPAFFAAKRMYATFMDNHHGDGHLCVWAAAPPGFQEMLSARAPRTYFRPPYVGVRGWIGIELTQIGDDELAEHLLNAWKTIAPAKRKGRRAVVE